MNILITYDYLTTEKNIGKRLCTGLDFISKILNFHGVNTIIDNIAYKNFPIQKLFNSLNLEYTNNRFQIIDFSNLDKNNLELILSYIKGYDLLITYELSNKTRNLFDKYDITYLDIWMSPIRFCKDIMFSFYSNDVTINKKLNKYAISNKTINNELNNFIDNIQYFSQDNIKVEQNSALIIGQVFQDKAVLKNNKFLTLIDYIDEIKALASKYNKLYLLKHPYMSKKDFEIIVKAFQYIDNIEYLSNVNIYTLLLKKEIKMVIGISSSVLYEAKYFNKEIHYLYEPVLNDSYTHIYKSYFQTYFWSDILNIKNNNKNIELMNYDNYLRYLFKAFYAYGTFMDDKKSYYNDMSSKIAYNSPVNLYNFISNIDKSKKYILYGYGSIAKLILPHIKECIIGIIDESLSLKNITTIDDLKVISVNILSEKDNVIITAFKYNNDIKNNMKRYNCNIITIDI